MVDCQTGQTSATRKKKKKKKKKLRMLLWTTAHDTKRRGRGGKETYKVRKQKTVLKLIPGKKMETSATTTKATFIATFTIPHMPAQEDQNTSSVRP